VIKIDNSTNSTTSPITPVFPFPTYGSAHGYNYSSGEHRHGIPKPQAISADAGIEAVSKLQIAEADKNQSAFREVDLGGMGPCYLDHSADKENVPPSALNYGSERLVISSSTDESTTSRSRIAKVSMIWSISVIL
jgi:hypothetical protein